MSDWSLREWLAIVPAVGLAITSTLLLLSLINERRTRQRDLAARVNAAVGNAVNEKFVTLFAGIFQAREQLAAYVKEAEASAQMLDDRVTHGTSTLNDAVARVDASIATLEQLLADASALSVRLQQYEEQVSEDAREVSETRDRVFAQVEEFSNAAQQFVLRTAAAESTLEEAGFTEQTMTLDLPILESADSPIRPTTVSYWTAGDRCLTFCLVPGSMIPGAIESGVRYLRPILEGVSIDEGLVLVFDWDGDDVLLRCSFDDVARTLPEPLARCIKFMRLEDLAAYLAATAVDVATAD